MSEIRPDETLLLGIDGGGTSTVAYLADGSGQVLGQGRAGPSNPKAIGFKAAFAALEAATIGAFESADRARGRVDVACLGLAGFAQVDDRRLLGEWSNRWGLTKKLLPVSDGALVLAAGTPDAWGIAVIAGTGSIVVGADQAGRTARAGGWGYRFGDEGSAYNTVVAGLRRTARRADGREPSPAGGDPLTEAFLAALDVADPSELVTAVYAPAMDRTRIAALASVILDAAKADPTIVADLLEPAGVDLALTVLAVARSLGWSGGPLPLALAGGFLLRADEVCRALLDHLRGAGFDPQPAPVPYPAEGAVILAHRWLDTPDEPA